MRSAGGRSARCAAAFEELGSTGPRCSDALDAWLEAIFNGKSKDPKGAAPKSTPKVSTHTKSQAPLQLKRDTTYTQGVCRAKNHSPALNTGRSWTTLEAREVGGHWWWLHRRERPDDVLSRGWIDGSGIMGSKLEVEEVRLYTV